MRFSTRTNWHLEPNRLTLALANRRARGLPVTDLTRSNPTTAGLSYPVEELAEILRHSALAPYEPNPRGLLFAREAVAEELSKRGPEVSPDDLILTASTSEAYSFLFKLLCNPGDSVLVPVPSYPLLDHLAALESVRPHTFPLTFHSGLRSRWALETHFLEEALDRTPSKAVVAIHPNNPTGNFLTIDELHALERSCAARKLPLISDEVFFDYPISEMSRQQSAAVLQDCLSFSLGGLSKSAGLPHWKLGWIQVSGPVVERRQALEGLELIADTFLSVSSPVQHTLSGLLPLASKMRTLISRRILKNLAALERLVLKDGPVELLPVEGGWSAVLRLPRIRTDEEMAVELLERRGVLVQPGYFFDFAQEGFLVVSLLGDEQEFVAGIQNVVDFTVDLCASASREAG